MRSLLAALLAAVIVTVFDAWTLERPLSFPSLTQHDRADGRDAALDDARRARYQYMSSGFPMPCSPFRWYLDRRGVEVIDTGCIVTPESEAYENGYNSVMRSALREHFGRDVIEEASWFDFLVNDAAANGTCSVSELLALADAEQ